jgi:hypothetical protein
MLGHVRGLWGPWWWVPALPWVGYAAGLSALGLARWEHVAVAGLAAGPVYTSSATRRFFLNALPFFLLFLLYDSMRYWVGGRLSAQGVLGCRLRDAELLVFGVRAGGELLTPNQLLGKLQHPAVDLLCAIPYGGYLGAMVGLWIYLFFRDPGAARRMAWIAFGTHLLGFATYALVPAAPPWYVDLHGCGIDLGAPTSPAGLTRVDAMLGITFFHDLYGRGATVFGALPSLHVTYPFYGLLATWGRRASVWSRAVQGGYAALMLFAAIYLNHHWLLDALLGLAYVFIAAAAVEGLSRRRTAGDRVTRRDRAAAAPRGTSRREWTLPGIHPRGS